ncbi:MAG: PD-(D/E)XK nuclease family protein, partial [Bacteroidales bacterium]|nr:PD-(D/E)XK nuclease family protein [Bacteroidales bacterium]
QYILSDFDAIEKELKKPEIEKLFRFISEIREIDAVFDFLNDEQKIILREFWANVDISDDTNLVKSYFVSFWKILLPIFENIKRQLTENEVGYEAMAYRETQKRLMSLSNHDIPVFCFVGFNALTSVQKEIFSFLQKKEKASFYWDYDQRFDFSKSSAFIKDNILKFGNGYKVDKQRNDEIETVFNEYPVPSEILQVDTLADILKGISETENTCIILNNEQLLVPLMELILKNPGKYNVSAGLSLSSLPTVQFLELLLELKLTIKNGAVFHTALLNLLNCSFIIFFEKTVSSINLFRRKLIKNIYSGNLSYLSLNFLKDFLPANLFKLFEFSKVTDLIEQWIYFLNTVEIQDDGDETNSFYKAEIIQILQFIDKLKLNLDELPENMLSFSIFRTVFKMLADSEKIHFQSSEENTNKIQVMGLLETRLMDFDNVILLSANDENFPKLNQNNSLIPYKIKKAFGLPTLENQEAIYSYTFYRLLYRAKKVSFIYNAIQDDFNRGEKSRFIYQLQFHEGLNFNRYSLETKSIFNKINKSVSVKKTPEVLSQLQEIQHFSSSALTTYLDCPLQYYLKYVKRLEETEDMDDDISFQSMGNVFHGVMSRLLNQGNYTTSILEKKIKDEAEISRVIREQFLEEMGTQNENKLEENGVFVFLNETIKYFVHKTLRYDLNFVPFEVLGVETRVELPIEIEANGQRKTVKLKGFIDRYDQRKNEIHIIDYKTGKINLNFSGMDSLFTVGYDDSKEMEKREYLFQLLFYALRLIERKISIILS